MDRSGFSLVEVMVALTIAGLTVSIAGVVFGSTADMLATLKRQAVATDQRENAWRWIDDAFSRVVVNHDPERWFLGGSDRLSFHTEMWVEAGWRELNAVELAVDRGRLTARFPDGRVLMLRDSVTFAGFDYLDRLGAGAPWHRQWESDVTVPLAVRLRFQSANARADTLLFLLGSGR